jgi:hypothetical protein
VARGLASPGADGLITLRNGRFVRYKLQGVEYLTTVLIDFTDVQHGQIPEPDRTIDNRTYWSADVSRGTTTTCCSRREADRTLSQVLSPTRTASRTYTASPVTSFFDSSPTACYNPAIPYTSVRTAGSGVKIDIIGASPDRGSYRVRVHR